ncbi:2,3-bisphosphoglycerate-independent phosphoglycerate mutase [Desulfohalovibrio reitneri]|uniref:2,3-bisphosphoglycerate-independent phosphoglycerate mutase n=1 Tax=Desulfohalovibrio reitneri TaxID=1307759 RepID=UPI0004A7499F|nr:2,3-bisphosphoglycerate-independent phosphoglycerate mutase [Desulfohalovibrio reitneri]
MPRNDPLLLLILDGWGVAPEGEGNAVLRAATPTLDSLQQSYPGTTLACSGRAVGLPEGFMGNSEVGHMNIGAGRVVYQDMTRIDLAIEDGSIKENEVLAGAMNAARESGGRLHLMGLVSDGGVHSHLRHLFALLAMAKERGVEVVLHAFLDGRDTAPTSGAGFLEDTLAEMRRLGAGRIATVSGRYYAMDRDTRFDRTKQAYDALVMGRGHEIGDPVAAVWQAYEEGENDEFVKPRVVVENGRPVARLKDGDSLVFFNFRADRARQISRAIFDDGFDEFEREGRPALSSFVTMTRYDKSFPMPVAFPPQSIEHTLGQTVSEAGLKQLRIAETEKYAHVTFFLNCGREDSFPGEERILVPSPREVSTYDQKPEMSAAEVTDQLLENWRAFDLMVCNLANLDMVGHTGFMDAVIQACQAVDECVGRIVKEFLDGGGRILLTADHGNSEEMLDPGGSTQTAHSTNPVPLVYIAADAEEVALAPKGRLCDIAPTILHLLGVEQPEDMSGKNLITREPNG